MNPSADVRSIVAVRDWLAVVAAYQSNLSDALAGVNLEIRKASDWLEDQGKRWAAAARQCEDEVVQAKAELANRRFEDASGRMPDTTVQERNLNRAKARLQHAQDQMAKCRAWLQKLPRLVEEAYDGPARRLQNFLDTDLATACDHLDRRVAALEAYAGLRRELGG